MNIPCDLIHSYFNLASRNLQSLIDSPSQDTILPESKIMLDWHRGRILRAQTTALDEVLLDWCGVNRDDVQIVLRQIGEGDFSNVLADNVSTMQNELKSMMDKTNELARKAYSNSVLFVEWRDHKKSKQLARELKREQELDKTTILEYCALTMSAVRLEAIQMFLEIGQNPFPAEGERCSGVADFDTAKDRLEYVQSLIWSALHRDAESASRQLQQLISEDNKCNNALLTDASVAEALTKYASTITVALNNATPSPLADDGTTRVINVSYSEKIVTLPQSMNGEDITVTSLSAPTSNTMHEHSSVQQRHQLDIAQKTSMLQQQIWDEFEAMPIKKQAETLERAETVQREFLEKIMNAPPGPERVLLMQSLNEEEQKLLVLHKLNSAQNSVKG